ncbi:hypothetical protein ACT453_31610, partial [Bacillus sp. D-CC]
EIKDFKKKICAAKLLIIDDFGLGGFNQALAPSFLEMIDKQSQSGGLLIKKANRIKIHRAVATMTGLSSECTS